MVATRVYPVVFNVEIKFVVYAASTYTMRRDAQHSDELFRILSGVLILKKDHTIFILAFNIETIYQGCDLARVYYEAYGKLLVPPEARGWSCKCMKTTIVCSL